MKEVCQLLGVHKVNTTVYHLQTDGLVERFNRMLTAWMLGGRNWDQKLPYVLFAYRASMQESTKESPFFLYGRDPRLPTEQMMAPPDSRSLVDADDYKTEMVCGMSEAWKLAQAQVRKAQSRQKTHCAKEETKDGFTPEPPS